MSVLDLVRPEILALQPYASARTEAGQAEVMLNANESPWPPAGMQVDLRGLPLNRYPDPQPRELLERMAVLYGVESSRILIGRGSDEAIDLLIRAFCRPGVDAVALTPPTFGMYAVSASVQGAARFEIPLDKDLGVDPVALTEHLPAAVKIVFLCSPNNPTGGQLSLGLIERVARAFSARAHFVVDEAYVEISGAATASGLLDRHENLAVLRTM
jgi:histidinol-phosphate aminotransferase